MTLEELIDKIKIQESSWDSETKEIFDEMWSCMEAAETDLEVFKLRLKKQWSKPGNLYTEKEKDEIAKENYLLGYDDATMGH